MSDNLSEFDKELAASPEFMELLKDDDFASKFYCSLENQDWMKGNKIGSHSFRGAGALIAALRGQGDYLDWYCAWGNDRYTMATVYPEVEQILEKLGWYPKEEDRLENKRRRRNGEK